MPLFYCQNYFLILENLSIAIQILIAKSYLIIKILKLELNNKFILKSYRGI